jgi:hypothetical protein
VEMMNARTGLRLPSGTPTAAPTTARCFTKTLAGCCLQPLGDAAADTRLRLRDIIGAESQSAFVDGFVANFTENGVDFGDTASDSENQAAPGGGNV